MSSPDDGKSDLDFGPTLRGLAANQRVFDRYELREFLGRGGMGIVWLAYDEQLERDVALKFLPELLVHDRAAMDDLKRETKRSLELTHHHIVRTYDFVQDGRIACISMEFVDGQTLAALRVEKENKIFEVEELEPLIEQACDALEYAHVRARIVHRDFKPTNLMLNSRGEVKVTDFGIARNLSDSVSTLSGRITGTVAYSSPQQLSGDPPSITDDVYSIGATLYELLTSKPPFYRGQIDRQIFNRIPPAIRVRRTELDIRSPSAVPVRWEETIAACLAKEPSDRPQRAADILKRLGLLSSLQEDRRPFSIENASDLPQVTPIDKNQSRASVFEPVRRALLIAWRPTLHLPVSLLVIAGTAAFAALGYILSTQLWPPSRTSSNSKLENQPLQSQQLSTVFSPQNLPNTPSAATKAELESMYDKAFREFNANNYPQALKELDAIDARQPDLAESQNLRGVILMRQAEYDQAEVALQKALATDPKFWNARFNLAEIPFLRKDWAEARKRFDALLQGNAAELQGEAAQLIQYKILLTYLLQGNEKMVDSIMAKFKLSPDTPAANYANAAIALQHKNEKEAKDLLAVAEKNFSPELNKLFAESLYEVGWLQKPSGQTRTALELTSAADRAAKAKALATENYEQAEQAFQRRELTAARRLVDEADAADPNQAPTINLRGEILLAQKDFDSAENAFRQAVKLDPKLSEAHYNLAQIPFKKKDYTKARDRFEALFAATTPAPGGDKNQTAQIIKFKIYLTLLLEEKDSRAQKMMEQFQFTGDTPVMYYAQAAWEFKHNNAAKANDWIVSARKIYSPALNFVFADSFYDLGWLQNQPTAPPSASTEIAKVEATPSIEPVPIVASSPRVETPVVSNALPAETRAPLPREPEQSPVTEIKEKPWENSLGMKFVPVPGTAVLFSIWETRVKDFKAFVGATGHKAEGVTYSLEKRGWRRAGKTWKDPGFAQTGEHAVGSVSWEDARIFCEWLTKEERKAGRISAEQSYRLPTDLEWSAAVGLEEEKGETPEKLQRKVTSVYPWGTKFPPPSGAGNYAGSEARTRDWPSDWETIEAYRDEYPRTSPVGSFEANEKGIMI